jgi:hypothetical protein
MAPMSLVCLLVVIVSLGQIHAFRSPVQSNRMLFNKRQLNRGMAETSEAEGYGPFGSLTRQGLVPYVIRLVNPTTYDAAVEKYMKVRRFL